MKNYWNSFKMCLSMFTIFPVKKYEWDDSQKEDMLMILPTIGAIIGGVWYIIFILLSIIRIHNFNYILAFIISIYPIFITGMIHVDGFMDVVDAKCSCRDIEKRKTILKDSRVGTFAVVYFVIFSIMNYISIYSVIINHNVMYFIILLFIPFFSRLMSVISLMSFEKMDISEYYVIEKQKIKLICSIVSGFVILVFVAFINIRFIFVILIEILIHFIAMYTCYKNFMGVNGDSSGYAIYMSESLALLAMSIIFNI